MERHTEHALRRIQVDPQEVVNRLSKQGGAPGYILEKREIIEQIVTEMNAGQSSAEVMQQNGQAFSQFAQRMTDVSPIGLPGNSCEIDEDDAVLAGIGCDVSVEDFGDLDPEEAGEAAEVLAEARSIWMTGIDDYITYALVTKLVELMRAEKASQ